MAVVQGFACRSLLAFRRPRIYCVHQIRKSSSVAAVESLVESLVLVKEEAQSPRTSHGKGGNNDYNAPEWKKLSSKDLGIQTSMIARSTRLVLNGLKKKGYEVYLVGGCVRDLILKRTPKDFDIITSAELREVLRTFPRCEIVGKRFPICHVHVDDTIVEVSSFSTSARKFGRTRSSCRKPPGCKENDFIRWRNCLQRDFTINGLMFDPFAKIVYDYTGGVEDIRKAKVRSVIPASTSFVEDCARILRGVRIAARLRFRFVKETAYFIKELSSSVLRLDKGRILMEMNYMLAYGSAEASLSLDKLLAPDRPCHCSLWVGILAFHIAMVDQPRDPLVVAAFCIAVHNGGSLSEAIDIARKISQPHEMSFHELSEHGGLDSYDALVDEVEHLAACVRIALDKMMDEHFVSQALINYPQAPQSDLVFIPFALSLKVKMIFQCVRRGKERGFVPKRGSKIDYNNLSLGRLHEVRHMFARIVFDTVYPPKLKRGTNSVIKD